MIHSKQLPYIATSLVLLNIAITEIISDKCRGNIGVAFGIYFQLLDLLIPLLIVILFLISIYSSGRVKYIFLSLCILGASNVLERYIKGYVCDYINILGISFNIVDMGIVLLCIFGILISISKKDERNS